MPKPLADAPEIEVTSRAALRDWLASNHDRPTGVWIVTYKKADPARHLPTTEIVDEALCWGWIDSLPRAKDAARTMLYLAPRKPGSGWSRVNKAKVARLEAAGRIALPGRAAIDRARADGSWAALDAVEDLILPEDLDRALATAPGLRQVWEGWPRSLRRGALEQLLNAKRPETRAARIAAITTAAATGTRPFQWRKT
jgi:uncharacterized protein YdeI (YjbR/CyaY-like superfamily)